MAWEWKLGDRAKCIEKSEFGFPGTLGAVYTVTRVTRNGGFKLAETDQSYTLDQARFKPVIRVRANMHYARPDVVADCLDAMGGRVVR